MSIENLKKEYCQEIANLQENLFKTQEVFKNKKLGKYFFFFFLLRTKKN